MERTNRPAERIPTPGNMPLPPNDYQPSKADMDGG